jgi:hypothetical protein
MATAGGKVSLPCLRFARTQEYYWASGLDSKGRKGIFPSNYVSSDPHPLNKIDGLFPGGADMMENTFTFFVPITFKPHLSWESWDPACCVYVVLRNNS